MSPNIKSVLITGGAGFIGSHLADLILEQGIHTVVLDALTYAGSLKNLQKAEQNPLLMFVQGNICNLSLVKKLLEIHKIDTIFHLAAESHVDNSIDDPEAFITTNLVGTYRMLEAARTMWQNHPRPSACRFIHISTDEVYGQLGSEDPPFTEETAYAPKSPYSASKAGSDHLASAWFHTYGLPVIVTHCTNNFGPRQHAEKLIPTVVRNALAGRPIPIYGNGRNVRDWIDVQDHRNGLLLTAQKGIPGETYCFSSGKELENINLARIICEILDRISPRSDKMSYAAQLTFVKDRLGHDWRYSVDNTKAKRELGFQIQDDTFYQILHDTVVFLAATHQPFSMLEKSARA